MNDEVRRDSKGTVEKPREKAASISTERRAAHKVSPMPASRETASVPITVATSNPTAVLHTNNPVSISGSSGSSVVNARNRDSASCTPASASTAPATEAAPALNPLFTKPSARISVPARHPHLSPASEGHHFQSCTPSATTDKTRPSSLPPSLPVHRATTSHDNAQGGLGGPAGEGGGDGEGGIVESSRSYLTRLSLEDAVMALERLRFLMMSHTAAVTVSQLGEKGRRQGGGDHALPVVTLPREAHVDPFKLSKRPLEDIAEELCSQLRRIASAYAVASAADRCLLGVPEEGVAVHPPSSCLVAPAVNPASRSPACQGPSANGGEVFGTFGPMVSTMHMTAIQSGSDDGEEGHPLLDTRISVETDDSWGAIDLHKANPGPRIAYAPRQDSDNGMDFGSTVYKYPNGTVVSYPVSTFGELVSTTESGPSTAYKSRGGTTGGGYEHRVTVSDGTQTDEFNLSSKKEAELQAYVKALEARLTEKQCLDAMRESRGAKKSSISSSLSRLAKPNDSKKPEEAGQALTTARK